MHRTLTQNLALAVLLLLSLSLAGLGLAQKRTIDRLSALLAQQTGPLLAQGEAAKPPPTLQALEEGTKEEPQTEHVEEANTKEKQPKPDPSGSPQALARERAEAVRQAMASPEFQRLVQVQLRGRAEAQYAALFAKLRLPPEAQSRFLDLIVEKQAAVGDVLSIAREQGLNRRENGDEIAALMAQTRSELDQTIRETIGDAAFKDYQRYEATGQQRALVDQVAQRLSYTATPMSSEQRERLTDTLVATSKPAGSTSPRQGRQAPLSVIQALGGLPPPTTVPVTKETLLQAQGFLAPSQVTVLKQIQEEQKAQQNAAQLLREAARPGSKKPKP